MTFSRDYGVTSMDKPGVAFVDGIRNTRSVTILGASLAANSAGKKALPAHCFIARYGEEFKFLKRAKVTTAFATNAATGRVPTEIANVFAPGDVLRLVAPYGTLTVTGTWAANDTATPTIAGNALTVTAADGVNANIAGQVAAAINNSPLTNWAVQAIAAGNLVYLYGKDGMTRHALAGAETTAGDGTLVASAASLALAATVGTVQSVDVSNGQITLTGNAGVAVPVGASLGVAADEIVGVYPFSLDLTNKERWTFAPITRCDGFYEQSCPHFDEQLRSYFNNRIIFGTRF